MTGVSNIAIHVPNKNTDRVSCDSFGQSDTSGSANLVGRKVDPADVYILLLLVSRW